MSENVRYTIRAEYQYYQGALNRRENGPLRDSYGNVMVFTNRESAITHIRYLEENTYKLESGEYARPELEIRETQSSGMNCLDYCLLDRNYAAEILRQQTAGIVDRAKLRQIANQ